MVKSAMSAQSHVASNSGGQADSLLKSTATIKLGGCMSTIAGAVILFVAFFGHVWMGVHSNALTRARKAFFDEANVLETYQPRARTMGHLFCPEPPTPAPTTTVTFSEGTDDNKKKHTAEENAAFNAMRDSHYANMFEYAMKMQKELQAMEKAGKGPNSSPAAAAETSSTQADAPSSQQPSSAPQNSQPASSLSSVQQQSPTNPAAPQNKEPSKRKSTENQETFI